MMLKRDEAIVRLKQVEANYAGKPEAEHARREPAPPAPAKLRTRAPAPRRARRHLRSAPPRAPGHRRGGAHRTRARSRAVHAGGVAAAQAGPRDHARGDALAMTRRRRARQSGVRGVDDRGAAPRAVVHRRHAAPAQAHQPAHRVDPDPGGGQPARARDLARAGADPDAGAPRRRAAHRRGALAAHRRAHADAPASRRLERALARRVRWLATPLIAISSIDLRARAQGPRAHVPRARGGRSLRAASRPLPAAPVTYRPKEFWEQRLGEHFDLRGTGETGLPLAYNQACYALRRHELERALRDAGVSLTGKRVLDVGSGTGFFVAFYLERGADVTGLDLAEVSVERLRQQLPARSVPARRRERPGSGRHVRRGERVRRPVPHHRRRQVERGDPPSCRRRGAGRRVRAHRPVRRGPGTRPSAATSSARSSSTATLSAPRGSRWGGCIRRTCCSTASWARGGSSTACRGSSTALIVRCCRWASRCAYDTNRILVAHRPAVAVSADALRK